MYACAAVPESIPVLLLFLFCFYPPLLRACAWWALALCRAPCGYLERGGGARMLCAVHGRLGVMGHGAVCEGGDLGAGAVGDRTLRVREVMGSSAGDACVGGDGWGSVSVSGWGRARGRALGRGRNRGWDRCAGGGTGRG